MINYYLYLDESGSFRDDKQSNGSAPSLVGGLFFKESSKINHIISTIPYGSHASEEYDKSMLKTLSDLKEAGGQFVIFENKERIKVVNEDITYLNILGEGIVKVLLLLGEQNAADTSTLNVLIARRLVMSSIPSEGSSNTLPTILIDEYKKRLEEKLILALGKNHVNCVDYKIDLSGAQRDKRLMAADYICNTYLTRKAARKFSQDEKNQIELLYSDEYIFPVFENATVGYLQRLYLEKRYGEMLCQLCQLPSLSGVVRLRNKLLDTLSLMPARERDAVFSIVSLQIGQLNYKRLFTEGIEFAKHFKDYILSELSTYASKSSRNVRIDEVQAAADYWSFDTDFFILTMYDHMGNAAMCNQYLEKCRANIGAVDRSWEHIDYYFKFRIRELNCLIGQFAFDEVIEKSDKLISLLTDARELFESIGAYDDTGVVPTSELLGKVYGVKLEALINNLRLRPQLFEQAVNVSDAALKEFVKSDDMRRQLQLRSQLMAEAGRADEALNCLMHSVGVDPLARDSYSSFVSIVCGENASFDAFSIMHYCNVLLALLRDKRHEASKMAEALINNVTFSNRLKNKSYDGHPWQLILWDLAIYYRAVGRREKCEALYIDAVSVATAVPGNSTMFSFALSMSADNLLSIRRRSAKQTSSAENEFKKLVNTLKKGNPPESMAAWFLLKDPDPLNERVLASIASSYLR